MLYSICVNSIIGHLIFEMSAGFELQQLKPGMGDYKTVHKAVKPVLEFIFDEEFSHSISEVNLTMITYFQCHTHFHTCNLIF